MSRPLPLRDALACSRSIGHQIADFLSTPQVSYEQFGHAQNYNLIESLYATLYHDKCFLCLAQLRVIEVRRPEDCRVFATAFGRFI